VLYKRHGWTLEGLGKKIDSIYSEPPREGELSSLIIANRSATSCPFHEMINTFWIFYYSLDFGEKDYFMK